MRRGLHPVMQWVTLVTPQGRVVKVLSGKVFKADRPFVVRDPGKQSEEDGQLAKFSKRFEKHKGPTAAPPREE